jgi:hypothetical protein
LSFTPQVQPWRSTSRAAPRSWACTREM